MRRYAAALVLLVSLSVVLCVWAATTDLRPDGTVTSGWTVTGSGTGNCAAGSGIFGCIDEDVDSHDSSTTQLSSTVSNDLFEVTFGDVPGDYSSTNSITLRCAVTQDNSDDNDRTELSLRTGGSQSGGTKCFSTNQGGGSTACTDVTTSFSVVSYTDSAWDALGSTEINNLSLRAVRIDDNVAMNDATNNVITACELVLDYNVAGANPKVRRKAVVIN